MLREVLEEMKRFNEDYFRLDYDSKEMLYRSNLVDAKEEGHAIGYNEGHNSGEKSKTIEIAKSMLKAKEPLDKIALYTKLSIEEIEELRKDMK